MAGVRIILSCKTKKTLAEILDIIRRMATNYSQISSKGQLVIPAGLREELNLSPGTRVSIRREGNTLVLRPITREFIDSLIGSTKGAAAERERTHRDDKR